jgi:hypothetical protein
MALSIIKYRRSTPSCLAARLLSCLRVGRGVSAAKKSVGPEPALLAGEIGHKRRLITMKRERPDCEPLLSPRQSDRRPPWS